MKKIEPALSQYRRNKDGVASRWITTQNPELMAEFGYEVRQLYTREALEAAVNAAVEKCELVTGARFAVDTAAIINQLTGE